MHRTFEALSLDWPAIATSGMMRWRAYRLISAAESGLAAPRPPSRSNGSELIGAIPGRRRWECGSAGLTRITTDQQASIMAAESETVRHHMVDPGLAGDVRDVIQVAFGVGMIEVDRRRQR